MSEHNNDQHLLAQTNEELLRSKGKLMQEIIELKKQIIQQDKNLKLIGQQQSQLSQLNTTLAEHVRHRAVLLQEIEDLQRQFAHLQSEKENALLEINRLQHITWYQRLFGKK